MQACARPAAAASTLGCLEGEAARWVIRVHNRRTSQQGRPCSYHRRCSRLVAAVQAGPAGSAPLAAGQPIPASDSVEIRGQQQAQSENSSSSSSDGASRPARLEGRWSYKMLKAQPTEVLLNELRCRRMPTWGRKDQLASRVYSAMMGEGRAMSKEESAVADAALGLDSPLGSGSQDGSGWDSSDDGEEGGSGSASGSSAASALLQQNPLLALQSSPSGRFLTENNPERLLSNASSLQLCFLWGGAAPNGIKHTTSCAVRTSKSVWLFECGEDAQRHLVRNQAIAWAKLDRIFISSLAADNILGVPGMLCTISAAREKGHESADTPLHVYGPPGLADYINTMLTVSRTYLEMPVIIHEFSTQAVPPDQLDEPVQINPRARLHVMRLPPDQLNPEGYYDGEIRTMLARHTRKRSNNGIDLRAGTLPLALPPPGNPRLTGLTVADLTWTLKMDHEWLVRVAPLRNKQPTFGFLLREADRSGRLYVDKAIELGVEPGVDFTRLKAGESVTTPDGRVVHASQCVGPVRRGRRLAIIGSCLDSATFAQAMAGARPHDSILGQASGEDAFSAGGSSNDADTPCDLVVHAMSYPAGAPAMPRSAAAMAGASAAALGAKELVLSQPQAGFLTSADGADDAFPAEVAQQAKAALGLDSFAFAGCHWCHQPEREEEPPH